MSKVNLHVLTIYSTIGKPIARMGDIVFDEETNTYTQDGKKVYISSQSKIHSVYKANETIPNNLKTYITVFAFNECIANEAVGYVKVLPDGTNMLVVYDPDVIDDVGFYEISFFGEIEKNLTIIQTEI